MLVKFVPPILISFVFQAVAQKPCNRKNTSKPKRLCANTTNSVLFSLTLQLQKSWTYPKILPVTCEWCRCILTLIIWYTFLKKLFVVTVSWVMSNSGNSTNLSYTKAYSFKLKLGILYDVFLTMFSISVLSIATRSSSKLLHWSAHLFCKNVFNSWSLSSESSKLTCETRTDCKLTQILINFWNVL